jgi:type II secretory pathway component PulF
VTDAVTFAYRAARQDGRIERGNVTAANRGAATESLAQRGLWALELREQEADRTFGAAGRRRLPVAQLALGMRVIAELLEAGLPVTRTLATFEELATSGWREALPGIRESVRQGKSLGASLGDATVAIPRDVIGIIQAGEAGSGLAKAVRRAAELTEDAAGTRAALRAALAYPFILATAGTMAVGLLVGVVLPRFALILADVGQALPPTTRAVLGVAAAFRRGGVPALVVATICLVGWRAAVSTPSGRRAWHDSLLRVPLLGGLRRAAAASRICGTLAALLESGVPLASALPHAARASGDAALTGRLLAAREKVVHGERLSRALATHGATTLMVVRLVRAGEESGRLAAMLAHAARLEREYAVGRTKALVRLLEPSLILIFGGIVAFVAAALLQALYSIRPGA